MDEENKKFHLAGKTFHEGDWLSIDGSTGCVYDGQIPTVDASIGGEFGRVMEWADKYRKLRVRTNADTPADAKQARNLGAEGIGLCRTEHMFFDSDRIPAIRRMICSDTVEPVSYTHLDVYKRQPLPHRRGLRPRPARAGF